MRQHPSSEMNFTGARKYVLDSELAAIVNISMALEMPLLLKGEPGTGKTMLAHAIAETLQMPLITLNVKSEKSDRPLRPTPEPFCSSTRSTRQTPTFRTTC